jgi:hypothetical protein
MPGTGPQSRNAPADLRASARTGSPEPPGARSEQEAPLELGGEPQDAEIGGGAVGLASRLHAAQAAPRLERLEQQPRATYLAATPVDVILAHLLTEAVFPGPFIT